MKTAKVVLALLSLLTCQVVFGQATHIHRTYNTGNDTTKTRIVVINPNPEIGHSLMGTVDIDKFKWPAVSVKGLDSTIVAKCDSIVELIDIPTVPPAQTLSISGNTISISSGNSINLPTQKHQETYTLTTNSSGVATVTFATYGTAPNVQAQVIGGDDRYRLTVTRTATSVTVTVVQQNTAALSLLGLDILTAGTTPINGATVEVLVTAK